MQIKTGRNTDGRIWVQLVRHDDDEETDLFCIPVEQAYQVFQEGLQICLTLSPELDDIPPELRI